MPSIDPTTRLAVILRAQVTALRGREAGAPFSRDKKAGAKPEPMPSDFRAAAAVIQQVRSIPAEHPNRRRQAFRLFLETVLASQFGARVLDDPQFSQMLAHVVQQFQDDATLSKAADEAARILLDAACESQGG